ncbi:MAG: hypothetical protein Q8P67_01620, partial [archaeon]|nr:hypothetical protein [archaeon]
SAASRPSNVERREDRKSAAVDGTDRTRPSHRRQAQAKTDQARPLVGRGRVRHEHQFSKRQN